MSDNWLEISDENINVEDIMRQIRARVAQRPSGESPESVAAELRDEMIGQAARQAMSGTIMVQREECDIVPHHYVIDWRIPILGPIHSVVRQIINAEIQRYLLPSLRKQSRLNLEMMRTLKTLQEENRQLREELKRRPPSPEGQPEF